MNTPHGVRDLQCMLRLLATAWPQLPTVAADGFFGENTLEAAMLFQRDFGLPVTGIVDRTTWDAMAGQCALLTGVSSSPLPHYLDPPSPVEGNDEGALSEVVRFMLNALARAISDFSVCEVNTPAFAENLRILQRLGALPVTGELDTATWLKLLRLFQLFVVRGRLRSPQ